MLKGILAAAILVASTTVGIAAEPTQPFANRAIKAGDQVCANLTGKKFALCRRDFINLALEPYLISRLAFSAASADSIGDDGNDNYYAETLTGDTAKFDAKLDALVRAYGQ